MWSNATKLMFQKQHSKKENSVLFPFANILHALM